MVCLFYINQLRTSFSNVKEAHCISDGIHVALDVMKSGLAVADTVERASQRPNGSPSPPLLEVMTITSSICFCFFFSN